MAHKRNQLPSARPTRSVLTAWMVGIGMRFAAASEKQPNIEDTLIFASEAGMVDNDFRVLSVLVTWLGVHHLRVNAKRITHVIKAHEGQRVCAFWAAIALWLSNDSRWTALRRVYTGSPVDVLPVGTDFHIRRKGEDKRFAGTPLRVATGTLRDRCADVLTPEALAAKHLTYRYRIQLGTSWRADAWAALEAEPDLTAAELARRVYCAFATAWQVKQDFELLQSAATLVVK